MKAEQQKAQGDLASTLSGAQTDTKFWEFNQNNSGGSFDFDEKAGITHMVIVEARTADEASARAQDIGIYFDGVCGGRDCGCCGDRWYEPYGEGDAEPMYYGKPLSEAEAWQAWMPDGKEICVHYLDGRREWFGVKVRK